jgi:hypothetical protein
MTATAIAPGRRTAARVALLLLVAGVASAARAQTVSYFYVAPTPSMAAFPGAVGGSLATGYSAVVVTAANQAAVVAALPPGLRQTWNALQAAQPARQRVDRLLRLNGGITDIVYALVDDRSGLPAGQAPFFATASIGGKLAAWPVAHVSPASAGRYRGYVRLGELACQSFQAGAGGWRNWEAVILHETSHTQMLGDATRWGAISITYGGDDGHYVSELLGDQELPFDEGIGTFFGLVHNDPTALDNLERLFSRTDERYLVESRSVLAGTAAVWNAPHTEEARDLAELSDPAERTGTYLWRRYRWKDVPGFYLLFAESTTTALHAAFWKHVNGNRADALTMVEASLRDATRDRRKRFPLYSANRLALQQEAFAATPAGRAARSAGRLTSSMYPFALADLVTHFGMTEDQYKGEYARHYPDREPLAFAQYWAHRARVQAVAQPFLSATPMRWSEAVAAVHGYFQQAGTILTPP